MLPVTSNIILTRDDVKMARGWRSRLDERRSEGAARAIWAERTGPAAPALGARAAGTSVCEPARGIILLAASAISAALGQRIDASIIVTIVVLSVSINFWQSINRNRPRNVCARP